MVEWRPGAASVLQCPSGSVFSSCLIQMFAKLTFRPRETLTTLSLLFQNGSKATHILNHWTYLLNSNRISRIEGDTEIQKSKCLFLPSQEPHSG